MVYNFFLFGGGSDTFGTLAGSSWCRLSFPQNTHSTDILLFPNLEHAYLIRSGTFSYDHSGEHTEHAACLVVHNYGQETRQSPREAVLEVTQSLPSCAAQILSHEPVDEN